MRTTLQNACPPTLGLIPALFGVLCAVLSAVVVNHSVVNEARRRVSLDLRSAWAVSEKGEGINSYAPVLWTA